MSLYLALDLEETDSMSVDISEDEVYEEASDSLNPTLIEDSKDGGGGYVLIGPEEAGDRVTSGRLPDSDMETEAELTETSPPIQLPDSAAAGVNIGKHGLSHAKPRTQTVTPAPTEQGVTSVMSSPKKPKLSPQKLDITQDTPKSSKSPFPHNSSHNKSPVRAEARVPASPPRHQFTFPQHLAVQCSDKILMHINRSVVMMRCP